MEGFISIIIATFIVAVFGIIIFVWIKKEKEIQREMLKELSKEQINNLKDNEVVIKNESQQDFSWYQKGIISRVSDGGSNYKLKVLWYNTVIPNNTLNDFQYADIKIKKEDYNKKGLKKGDIVKVLIEPHKSKGTII